MASDARAEDIREEDYEGIPIHQLPVEILLMIFDELGLEDLFQVEKVCRRWRNIAGEISFLWEKHMKGKFYDQGDAD
jgi:hypothetical protein